MGGGNVVDASVELGAVVEDLDCVDAVGLSFWDAETEL